MPNIHTPYSNQTNDELLSEFYGSDNLLIVEFVTRLTYALDSINEQERTEEEYELLLNENEIFKTDLEGLQEKHDKAKAKIAFLENKHAKGTV